MARYLLEERRYCGAREEQASMDGSEYSEEPRMMVFNKGPSRDPLGVLASYSRLKQSELQDSLDKARESEVAPMF